MLKYSIIALLALSLNCTTYADVIGVGLQLSEGKRGEEGTGSFAPSSGSDGVAGQNIGSHILPESYVKRAGLMVRESFSYPVLFAVSIVVILLVIFVSLFYIRTRKTSKHLKDAADNSFSKARDVLAEQVKVQKGIDGRIEMIGLEINTRVEEAVYDAKSSDIGKLLSNKAEYNYSKIVNKQNEVISREKKTESLSSGEDTKSVKTEANERHAWSYRETDSNRRIAYRKFSSPIGSIYVAGTINGLCCVELKQYSRVNFEDALYQAFGVDLYHDKSGFVGVEEALSRYFSRTSEEFRFSLDLRKWTSFKQKVFLQLKEIPWGTTRSYSRIAEEIGRPKALMLVVKTIAANPMPIIVPCHRVICSDGKLGSYRYGAELKRKLLQYEGISI